MSVLAGGGGYNGPEYCGSSHGIDVGHVKTCTMCPQLLFISVAFREPHSFWKCNRERGLEGAWGVSQWAAGWSLVRLWGLVQSLFSQLIVVAADGGKNGWCKIVIVCMRGGGGLIEGHVRNPG